MLDGFRLEVVVAQALHTVAPVHAAAAHRSAVDGAQAAQVAHVEHAPELDGAVDGGGVGGEPIGGGGHEH